MPRVSFVVSCEHGGREVPERYAPLFETSEARFALGGHRGWDPGSAELGAELAHQLGAPLIVQRTTRLLVECNRSLGHPSLWSDFSKGLPPDEKEEVLRRYWHPHRDAVLRAIDMQPDGLVVHVGVHSFTPIWNGRRRVTDIGLLHDPRRATESGLVRRWRAGLQADEATRGLVVHRNRPYRGWTDGLVTTLRGALPESRYAGIELEVSQALMPLGSPSTRALADRLVEAAERSGGSERAGAKGPPDPPQ